MPVKIPSRAITSNTRMQSPKPSSATGHLSDAVRADLEKLHPEQRAEILRVANTK
jgi:hypothetical protein